MGNVDGYRGMNSATHKDTPTKILFINLYTNMGGGEYAILNLLKGMDRNRFKPIMMFNQRGPFVEKVEAIGVETVMMPYPTVMLKKLIQPNIIRTMFKASREVELYLKANRVDVIHTTDVLSLLLIARSVIALRITVVYNVIFFMEWTRMILFNLLALVFVKRIVTNSHAIRNDLLARTVGLERKSQVIYYGIDLSLYRPRNDGEMNRFREEMNIPTAVGTFLVGMAARMDVWKGHATFLEAASRILQKRNDVRFVVIGGLLNEAAVPTLQNYYDGVMECRRRLGLEESVRFIPNRNDMPEVFRGLDVLVCPSKREPIPLIVFEAMASGVPVVGADSGGIPEQIEHGKEGLLFTTGDAASLESAICELLESSKRRRLLATAARKKMETRFSMQRFVNDMEAMYDDVL